MITPTNRMVLPFPQHNWGSIGYSMYHIITIFLKLFLGKYLRMFLQAVELNQKSIVVLLCYYSMVGLWSVVCKSSQPRAARRTARYLYLHRVAQQPVSAGPRCVTERDKQLLDCDRSSSSSHVTFDAHEKKIYHSSPFKGVHLHFN